MSDKKDFAVPWIQIPKSNQELRKWYDEWATEYEQDMQEIFGYTLPQRGAELMGKILPDRSRQILDAGTGTGLVGQFLSEFGYRNLVGIDLSPGMLEEAGSKGVYSELHQMTLGEPLEFASRRFDAVISIGVLTSGHAPPSSLDEIIRVTSAGGVVLFSMRRDTYEDWGFTEKQESLVADGKWRLLDVTTSFPGLPKGESETQHRIYAYEVL